MNEVKHLRDIARRSAVIEIPGGQSVELRSLTISDWATLEEQAVQFARREWIISRLTNGDILPPFEELDEIKAAFAELQDFVEGVKIADEANWSRPAKSLQRLENALSVVALADHAAEIVQETMPPRFLEKWMNSLRGNLTAVWLSMRAVTSDLTLDQVSLRFAEHPAVVRMLANEVVKLSLPGTIKNVAAPQAAGQAQTAATTQSQTVSDQASSIS